jgi:Chalcone isomerase-like
MKNLTRPILVATALTMSMLAAQAAEVSGIKFDETATVGGKPLVLNGIGVRYKLVKVYALGLYLSEKKNQSADVLALTTPKRFRLVLLREITSDELGQAFLTGVNKNLNKDEKGKFVNQLVKFGELFNDVEGGKKGDTLVGDYIPGTGTVVTMNGKQLGAAIPDLAFFNAILRVWIGDSPADPTLKPLLLGEEPASR